MKISLLKNAYSFLDEALSNAIKAEKDTIRWKYAILNLVQAIELSLKEKLRQEHPILIFQKIDTPRFTVNLCTALNRLQNISKLKLSKSDVTTINKAAGLRNQIVHFEFSIDEKRSKLIFAKLLGFLSHFHLSHLDTTLDQVLDPFLWQEALSVFEYAEELFNRALEIFKGQGIDPELAWTCPNCEWEAFITQDNINSCYVCGLQEEVSECAECGKELFQRECNELQTGDEIYENFCLECYENKIRKDEIYYHEMMSHFWGK